MQSIDGTTVEIKSIAYHHGRVEVYNLHVLADNHTFFAAGILVHNMQYKELLSSLGDLLTHGQAVLEDQLQAVSLELTRIDSLEERVAELESTLRKIAEAFGVLGTYSQRTVFVRQQSDKVRAKAGETVITQLQLNGSIYEFGEVEQEHFIRAIAEQTQTPPETIKLWSISSGSTLVTLEMPEEAALRLLSLYLNRSPFIDDLRIERVELRPLLKPGQLDVPQLPSPSNTRIRILFLAANPIDTPPLRLGEEVRAIEHALRSAEFGNTFDIVQCWATRAIDLQSCLLRHIELPPLDWTTPRRASGALPPVPSTCREKRQRTVDKPLRR